MLAETLASFLPVSVGLAHEKMNLALILVLADDVPADPLRSSIDVASLAPDSEITIYLWTEPPRLKARTIDRARSFIHAHSDAQ